ncbi:MAG TPA: hypothetical protein VN641_17565 [Urbifossiella sp.]|jgi:hypothetical protein|nr:hypothetical protein [Urbifossiella sp.]
MAANPFGLHDVYGNAVELAFTPQGRPIDRGGDAGNVRLAIAIREPL